MFDNHVVGWTCLNPVAMVKLWVPYLKHDIQMHHAAVQMLSCCFSLMQVFGMIVPYEVLKGSKYSLKIKQLGKHTTVCLVFSCLEAMLVDGHSHFIT